MDEALNDEGREEREGSVLIMIMMKSGGGQCSYFSYSILLLVIILTHNFLWFLPHRHNAPGLLQH